MKNFSLSAKFTAVNLVFSLTIIVVFTLGYLSLSKTRDASLDLETVVTVDRSHVNQAMMAMYLATIDQRDLVQLDEEASKDIYKHFHESINKFNEHSNILLGRVNDKNKALIESSLKDFKAWVSLAEKANDMANKGDVKSAFTLMRTEGEILNRRITENYQGLIEFYSMRVKAIQEENDSIFVQSRNVGAALSLFGLLVGVTFGTLIARNLSRTINSMVGMLNDSANQVASASQQIASASSSLSQASTEQASSLEETSSAIEEMNSMVGRNAQAAKESSQLAQQGVQSANRGQAVVENMMSSMEAINAANKDVMQQTNESNQRIAEIVSVINEIGNKTKVINEIVFQTKLLSFNASVEAARAGEHGKGFAVVAEEVGNLAQMSGNAAKDITALLDGSIEKVESIVKDSRSKIERIIADNSRKVEEGTRIAVECRDVLKDIVQGISTVSRMVDSVAEASDEQSRGINEINRAIVQLDQVTQTNAATSEEAASASEELSAQAEHMRTAVQGLALVVRGGNSAELGSLSTVVKEAPKFHEPKRVPSSPKKATSSASQSHGNVIRLGGRQTSSQTPAPAQTQGRVVGSDVVPSEDDPRFKDV